MLLLIDVDFKAIRKYSKLSGCFCGRGCKAKDHCILCFLLEARVYQWTRPGKKDEHMIYNILN